LFWVRLRKIFLLTLIPDKRTMTPLTLPLLYLTTCVDAMKSFIRPDLLAINPHHQFTRIHLGKGRHQVIVVDRFYRYPEEVLQTALELSYTARFEIVGNFPGIRATLNLDTAPLISTLAGFWGCPLFPFFSPQPVVFQGIKTQAYKLNVGQRQPHIDQDITAMVYLNPSQSCMGGTGLYRHRPTDLERVPLVPDGSIRCLADRLELSDEFFSTPEGYENFQNSMIFNPLFARRDNTFINEGNEYWELLHCIDMKPNRLIIFDGRCFHSQFIRPGDYDQAFRVNQILYLRQDRPSDTRSA
jgi:hypothetical protein